MKRRAMKNRSKDRRKFSKTALRENAKNHHVPRGGFRL